MGGGAKMSEAQLRWLVSFLSVHLEDVTVQNALFALLRVILAPPSERQILVCGAKPRRRGGAWGGRQWGMRW